jgi:hypothetical protein
VAPTSEATEKLKHAPDVAGVQDLIYLGDPASLPEHLHKMEVAPLV